MVSIRERKSTCGKPSRYQAVVRVEGYKPKRKIFRTKTEAKRWWHEMNVAIRSGKYISPLGSKVHTVEEMIDRYLKRIIQLGDGKKGYV